jgi:hypothetical protein
MYISLALVNSVMTRLLIFCSNILASAMTTAMSPELQTLEALKKESLLHCKVLQHIEELRENHARQYDDIKQKQHETLAMVMEATSYPVFIVLRELHAVCRWLSTHYHSIKR